MHNLEAGQEVEVQTRFDGTWVDGYRIQKAVEHGYIIRRLTDGATLPVTMEAHELRSTGTPRLRRERLPYAPTG